MTTWKVLPLVTALLVAQSLSLSARPPLQPGQSAAVADQAASVPLYRVTVVQGSARAINYRNLKRSTEIDLVGTVLAPNASGEAKVKSEDGAIQITAKIKNLPPATSFGGEFLTYVLWGISPEGRATNLGEVLLKRGKGKVKVIERLQSFGLVVTAEPYFAVSQPSDVIVLENAVRKGGKEQFEFIDAKYELLQRGQYTLNLTPAEPLTLDAKTPFEVHQARNAVAIARATGASAYAPEALEKAQGYLTQAELADGSKKGRIMAAREAVQRSEDARLIAVQRQDAERVAMEQKVAQDKLEAAKREAALAAAAESSALRQVQATATENAGLRSKNEGLQARNEGLRARLLTELNTVLQTRATARGLIVNMSGVLFQNGKAALLPAAREKLAKIAGILSTHKGLRIEAEGFTDSNGTEGSNQSLSEKRAENTKNYLVQQGVQADSISFKGFGESNPIAANDTAAGRQENRRVELVVSGEGLSAPSAGSL